MAVYIGVDLQVRTQTVCWLDTADGEEQQLSLDHERDDVRAFYSRFPVPALIGVETSGYSLWFHRIIEELGHQLLFGDLPRIKDLDLGTCVIDVTLYPVADFSSALLLICSFGHGIRRVWVRRGGLGNFVEFIGHGKDQVADTLASRRGNGVERQIVFGAEGA